MKLSLTARMVLGFGSAIVIVLISSMINLFNLQLVRRDTAEASSTLGNVASVNHMQYLTWDIRLGVLRVLLDKNDVAFEKLNKAQETAASSMAELGVAIAPGVKDDFKAYDKQLRSYFTTVDTFLSYTKEGDWEKALALREKELRSIATSADKSAEEFDAALGLLAAQATERSTATMNLTVIMSLLTSGLTLLAAIIAMVVVLRSIRRPVNELVAAAQTMGKGDFTVDLQPAIVKDEIGRMNECVHRDEEQHQAPDRAGGGGRDERVQQLAGAVGGGG